MLGQMFTCNICGQESDFAPAKGWRESQSCRSCGSSVRMRHIVHCLTTRTFGFSRSLTELQSSDCRVIGLSDPEILSNKLNLIFSYTNTYYHQSPCLDICCPDSCWLEAADVLISSDVFEHVLPPVQKAFFGAISVLRPGGTLVLTVPYDERPVTSEHYPDLESFRLLEFDGTWLMVGRNKDGQFLLHDKLVFHGGQGSTMEMRFFSLPDILSCLRNAGFEDIRVHNENIPKYGIFNPDEDGMPISARKPF